MNCPDKIAQLQQYLDTQLPAEWPFEVEQHLAECAECRKQFSAARVLEAGLKAMPTPEPPAYLTDDILAGVLADRRLRFRRRVTIGLAVAAAFLLAVIPVATYFLAQPPSPQLVETPPVPPKKKLPEPPPTPEQKQTPNVEPVQMAALSKQVDDLRNVVWSISDETQVQAKSWLNALSGEPKVPSNEVDAGDPVRETGAVVSSGLQPVANSAQRAVSYFVRELPTWKSSGKAVQ